MNNLLQLMNFRLRRSKSRLTELAATVTEKRYQAQLKEAENFLQVAELQCLELSQRPNDVVFAEKRAAIFEALIRAAVEMDFICHPEIDPNEGWVNFSWQEAQPGQRYAVVDTQLLTLYFAEASGALIEFDYKPRKLNLCNVCDELKALVPSLTEQFRRVSELTEPPPSQLAPIKSVIAMTRETKGLLGLRLHRDFSEQLALVSELLIRGGIGAHLNNATTGFSLEFWLQGGPVPAIPEVVTLTWNIALPTFEPTLLAFRPLLCVGGVSEAQFDLSSPLWAYTRDYPGGVYGVRLIDSLKNFVVDFRTAKPTYACHVQPRYLELETGERLFQGLQLEFLFETHRLQGDDHSNTLFLSII